MLTAYMRRMRNNNLEIRIAGSSCRIKRSTNGKKEGTGGITTPASALQVCYSDDYRFELPTWNNVRYKKCIRSVWEARNYVSSK